MISPGLLLAPGAGASSSQPSLVAIDEAASAIGWDVVRMDFPYRLAGRRAPDRAPVLLSSVTDNASQLAARCDPLVLGGRSMGGRICSMAVAGGLKAAGLVLISYPLHPPGRPEKLRVDHFGEIQVPCLFVSGTRDAFGSPSELRAHTETIPGPVQHHWIEGGDHGLRGKDQQVTALVRDWLADLHSTRAS